MSTIICELIPWTVNFVGVPVTFNFVASFSEIHEWLQAESHKTSTVSDELGDSNSTSVTCNKPLTSETEGLPELSRFSNALTTVTLVFPDDSRFPVLVLLVLEEKIRYAPCRRVLCVLEHPSFMHFLGFGQLRKKCSPLRQEKHNLLSAAIFALCGCLVPENRTTP